MTQPATDLKTVENDLRHTAQDKFKMAFILLVGKPGMSIEDQVANVAKARALTSEAHKILGTLLESKSKTLQASLSADELFGELASEMPSMEDMLAEFAADAEEDPEAL